ncbi:hypothetical protein KOY48_00730 [Candidatus Minimicrobia naudis]|uniref:Uncharacterized protein n=1 Tax=Candidatus Minimicrobia naudis TaxID=2841263 RepID=A0A8F1SBC7_9BACT|nr:hypothetical protein KOY48_00730 [Candidatus Minimicrobia naudis]
MMESSQLSIPRGGQVIYLEELKARLQIGDDFAYPNNAVELKNSLCKDFSVSGGGSATAGRCKP